ncbi:MAG: rRNA maturation RNase YbeY [Chloroflexi bacterium]|nr:rRNA maturation RNase YbeY [Chloroflexota bacterium]
MDKRVSLMNAKRRGSALLHVDVLPLLVDSVDLGLINKLVDRVLTMEGIQEDVELSLVITDDERIRELNATYRGIDEPTDVLSFPLTEPDEAQPEFITPPDQVKALGDVVISYERAVEQAREYEHSVEREIGYLVVHGVLHLLGYDHETEAQRQEMRSKEEAALVDLPRFSQSNGVPRGKE